MEPERVVVAGDWHGNVAWAEGVVKKMAPYLAGEEHKMFLQLGDFGIWPGLGGAMYLRDLTSALADAGAHLHFIDGNHEDFTQIERADNLSGGNFSDRVHHLSRGTRWTWHGRRWLMLGGATSLDRRQRIEGKSWWPQEAITPEQAERVILGGPVDVMVTHECPSSVVHAFPDFGFPAADIAVADSHRLLLQGIVDEVQPSYLIHGHLHMAYERMVEMPYGECRVTGLNCDGQPYNYGLLNVRTMQWELT